MVAEATRMLAAENVNIATLQLYRERRGGNAVMILETDQPVEDAIAQRLRQVEGILEIRYIPQER